MDPLAADVFMFGVVMVEVGGRVGLGMMGSAGVGWLCGLWGAGYGLQDGGAACHRATALPIPHPPLPHMRTHKP